MPTAPVIPTYSNGRKWDRNKEKNPKYLTRRGTGRTRIMMYSQLLLASAYLLVPALAQLKISE